MHETAEPIQPLATPPPAVIDRDLSCAGCEYNLRGMRGDGVCPECGATVARAVEVERMGRTLAASARTWRRIVVGGLVLWIVTLAMDFSLELIYLGFLAVRRRMPAVLLDGYNDLDGVLTVIAVFLVTARHRRFEAAGATASSGAWWRWASRATIVLAVLSDIAVRMLVRRYGGPFESALNVSVMAAIEWMAAVSFLFVVAHYARLGGERQRDRCLLAGVLWAVVAVLTIIAEWNYFTLLHWRQVYGPGVRVGFASVAAMYRVRTVISLVATGLSLRIAWMTMRMFLRSLEETARGPVAR